MQEIRIDTTKYTPADIEANQKNAQICFRLNQAMPYSEEYWQRLRELFGHVGEGTRVMTPTTVVRGKDVKLGNNVVVMNNVLFMSAGGITIDDNVLVAANAQLISNNHDLHNHQILICKPVHLKRNCWVGAGATILPGVTVGENAVVGAAAVVTHDVPDNAVVVGNPARVIKMIEP